jgi:uncharacterized membrane protein (DUF2068 family)
MSHLRYSENLGPGESIIGLFMHRASKQADTESPNDQADHHQWLVIIGALKLLKGFFCILLGFGALRLLHKDLVDIVTHWVVLDLHFDPESHFIGLLLTKAALIGPHQLRLISAAIFAYAALDLIEGTGLVLEKVWAEYVTLTISIAFLPWEIYELIRKVTWFKVGLALANMLMVLYLLWIVQEQAKRRRLRRLGQRA